MITEFLYSICEVDTEVDRETAPQPAGNVRKTGYPRAGARTGKQLATGALLAGTYSKNPCQPNPSRGSKGQ